MPDRVLLQLVKGEPNLAIGFRHRLAKQITSPQSSSQSPRAIAELFQAAKREEKETKQRQKREAEAKRIEELKQFASQEAQAWKDIDRLLVKAQAKPYEEAVKLLVKLRDLAVYSEIRSKRSHNYLAIAISSSHFFINGFAT